MKRFAEQLKKQAETVRMSAPERDALRERLLAYMDYHPLPAAAPRAGILRRFASGQSWYVGRFVGVMAVMLLIVVPALAENALPGDTLYPIKIRFNEELRGAMTSSPYQKVEWETERLERRLAEAQLLADDGRLTPAAEADVAKAIKQHTEAAKASIDTIRRSDKDEAALAEITLSSTLEVSQELLTKREEKTDRTASSTLSGAVTAARATLAPAHAGDTVSYAKLLSRVEADTTRAYEYFNSLNTVMTDADKSDIKRRLTDLQVKIDAAALMKDEDEAGAAAALVDVLGNVRKLISFMTNLDVRANVPIEDLVPLIPTDSERQATIEQKLHDAAALVADTERGLSKVATSSNDYLALTDSVAQYRELEKTGTEALAAGDLSSAEVAVAAALELATALKHTMVGLGIDVDATINATSTDVRKGSS